MARPSNLALRLLALAIPRAERDELLGDIRAEYAAIAASTDERAADTWFRRQVLASMPGLLRLNWLRASTGFEPRANAFTPGVPHMQHWIADARFASRRLRTRPAYTLLAVLTLALGIGGTAAIFGIARPILFDPLPYANAGDVVS